MNTTVRTKDEEGHKRDSFCVMVTAVNRYLTEKENKRLIILERGFTSLKQILVEKVRLLE